MKKNLTKKYSLTLADAITVCRMIGTLFLLFLRPFSAEFLWIYAFTGLTDALDGWIARKTGTASDFGARLDSIADLLFYAVTMFRLAPLLWDALPEDIWYAVAVILLIRVSVYLIAAKKYRRFASLHTYLNKLTGGAVFLIPFLCTTGYAAAYCRITCGIAAVAALEELILHLRRKTYCADIKSIFQEVESI